MKSKAAAAWCVLSIVLATILVVQWNDKKALRYKLEKLQLQVEKMASDEPSEARVQQLEKERLKLMGELRAAENELNNVRVAGAAAKATNAPESRIAARNASPSGAEAGAQGGAAMGKMLGDMLKNPEMRKAMEQQQRMAMDMIYGSLVKKLQLNPEDEKKFKDLLLAQQMENLGQAGAMFDPEADRNKVSQELATKRKEQEEKIKEVLGEEKFNQYQDYNQTIGERMMLEQFARGTDISTEQNEQILAIMREEKKNVEINLGNPTDPNQNWQAVLASDEAMQRIFSQQQEVNQRVIERAGQLLTQEQIQKLEQALKDQQAMQEASLKMARQMFSSGDAPKPPVQPTPVSEP
jgi:hypothetical protein